MTPDGTKLLDEGRMVFDGRQHHPTIEGPKLYKRNGYYYIFAPAGGVTSGWQTVLRSRNIFGPYEDRIVLEQGKTSINGPHQGGWVETQSGESWFVHFQDRAAYGRIVHLQPVNWIDDWPVIGLDADGDGKGEPVSVHKKPNVGRVLPVEVPQTTDEFNTAKVGLQWQWHANWKPDWWSNERKGWLRLRAQPPTVSNLWSAPNLLLQKLPAFSFSTTTKIDGGGLKDGDRIGLLIMGMDYSYLAVVRRGSKLYLEKIACKNAPSGTSESAETSIEVDPRITYLRVTVSDGASCRFSYSQNGREFHAIGEEFNAKPGRWIGAKVGLFAIGTGSGYADVDWFRFEK
jgi:beta-xylosidase